MARPQPIASKLRVFISYSRRDNAIADALVEALGARGFEVTIDRRDLPFGEKWQAELADFIRQSDTVVLLVSESSIQSKWVNWELDEVAKRNKRLVPVMVGDARRDTLPRQLGEIHILPAEGVFDPAVHLDALVRVLETDFAWLKEASRLADRASEWLGTTQGPALLLRGQALTFAERWKDLRPAMAPAPPAEVLDLILASRRAATRRQRWWVGGALAVAAGAVVLAGLAYWQRDVAVEQTVIATRATEEARNQAEVADTRRRETVELRKVTQVTESGLLSQAAKDVVERDPVQAMLLALDGLPDATTGTDRPLVVEAQLQLDYAFRSVRERSVLAGHDGAIETAAFSPDGRLVVTTPKDNTARLFDVTSGRQIARLAHDGKVNGANFSPDGRLVATASSDNTARLFDADSGKEVTKLEHGGAVSTAKFSPDGKMLATASSDQTARLFDTTTWKEIARLPHDVPVWDVAFSPNGKLLAANYGNGIDKGEVQVLAVPGGREIAHMPHDTFIAGMAFSQDGRRLATAGSDNTARLFETSSGKQIAEFSHDDIVNSVAFSPNGKLLATASSDKMARIFEAASGKEIARLPHGDVVWRAAFSSDGKLLATASWDKTARLFEIDRGKEIAVLPNDNQVLGATFSPDDKLLLIASEGTTARVFNVVGGTEDVRLPHDGAVRSAAFSPDGKVLATASDDKTARLFDFPSGKEIARFSHGGEVMSAAFSADGKLLATASYDDAAHLFEVASRKEIAQLAHGCRVNDVAFSLDGKFLATACGDKMARLFDLTSRKEIARLAHNGIVLGVAFSPDGKLLATAANGGNNLDGEVRLFDVASNKQVTRLPHDLMVSSVAFSPDGHLLASASSKASVFEIPGGKEITGIGGYDVVMHRVAFSPDGKLLATSEGFGETGSAHLFELASGKTIAQMMHGRQVNSATFSPDGLTLATASDDRTARLWHVFPSTQALVDAAKARAARCLTQAQRKQYFLSSAPPLWCVERRLWPYHSDDWQAWLTARKAGKDAPLPAD